MYEEKAMQEVTIYCSGSIQKGKTDTGKLCWTDVEKNALADAMLPHKAIFLNPDDPLDDHSNTMAVFGRDMYQVQFANFVVVDARQRRGIGIGIEMVASKLLGTPLIAVVPKNTYYRQDKLDYRGSEVHDYIHPHLLGLADHIVGDFEQAGTWIKSFVEKPQEIKSTRIIYDAIDAYKNEILPKDIPMLEILKTLGRIDE
jgi:hypothetical protein